MSTKIKTTTDEDNATAKAPGTDTGSRLTESLPTMEQDGRQQPTRQGTVTDPDSARTIAQDTATKKQGAAVNPTSKSSELELVKDYDDMHDYLERHKPKTAEQLAKEERLRKVKGIVAGVTDAVSSIANLIGTHNYAPNMYDPTKSMSAAMRARWDKEKADYEAKQKEYYDYVMKRAGQRRTEKLDQQKLQRQLDNDAFSQQYKQLEHEYKILLATNKHEEAQAKLEEMRRLNDAKIAHYSKTGDAAIIRASKAGSRSGGGGSGGSGGKGTAGKYPYYDEYGNVQYAPTKAAADFYNGKNGYATTETRTERTDKKGWNGESHSSKTKQKDAIDHKKAAENRAKKKPSPTAGTSTQKKASPTASSAPAKKKSPTK